MAIVERFTRRSGLAIRYLDNAPDQAVGLPILFSPGLTDRADEYAEMLAFFVPRRLIVVEVRGRGGSESPPTGYRAADQAGDLRAVLAEERIDRFHLVTFSRGTTWGLDVALAAPDRVATVSIGDYWAVEKQLPVEVAERVLASRFRGTALNERVEPHVVTELLRVSVARDLHDALAAAGIPVLVATGTEPGCLLDADAVEHWRRHVPGVEIVVIEGASHDLFRPDRLAYPRAVRDFIERSDPAP